jgi:hypothetical protein
VVDLGICSALPSSGGIEFRQGVRTLRLSPHRRRHACRLDYLSPRYIVATLKIATCLVSPLLVLLE